MAKTVVLRFAGDSGDLTRTFMAIEAQSARSMAAVQANVASAGSGVMSGLGAAAGAVTAAGVSMRRAGTRMALGITAPLAFVAKAAFGTAAEYEQNMNVLQEVSGATGRQMVNLGKLAERMGADIRLPGTSAADAAAAMLELAKAGLSVDQIMGATHGVLQLSAAGGLDNATAASVAANALNAFKLSGDKASMVADLLAAAANASSAEVSDLADSLTQGASVFAQAGIPIEDFVTQAALLANVGIKGSDAGTSLKTMMLKLQNPTEEAARMMRQLGVSVYDAQGRMLPFQQIAAQFAKALADGATHSAVNSKELAKLGKQAAAAEGSMGGLTARVDESAQALAIAERAHADVVAKYGEGSIQADRSALAVQKASRAHDEASGKLEDARKVISDYQAAQAGAGAAISKMDQQQRDAALGTIFGSDAVRAANAVLLSGEAAYSDMRKAVSKEGAAAKLAASRNKGLAGAIDGLKSSLETFSLQVVKPALPVVAKFITLLAEAIPKIATLPKPVLIAAGAISALLAAAGPLLFIFGAILSPVGLVVAALAGLGAVVYAALNPAKVGAMVDLFGAKWAEIGPKVAAALSTFGAAVGDWLQTNGPVIAARVASWAAAFVEWILPMIPPALERLGQFLGRIFEWVSNVGVPLLAEKLKVWIPAFTGWVAEVWPPFVVEMHKLLAKMVAWIVTDGVPAIWKASYQLGIAMAQGIGAALRPAVMAVVTAAINAAIVVVNGFIDKINILPGVDVPNLPLLLDSGDSGAPAKAVGVVGGSSTPRALSAAGSGGSGDGSTVTINQTINANEMPTEAALEEANRANGWRLAVTPR